MAVIKALMWARNLRLLWQRPQRTANVKLPNVRLSGQRAKRPSDFMCPISGSMALRRLSSFASRGFRPRRVPLINTRVVSTPWPRFTTSRVGSAQQDPDLLQRLSQRLAVIGIARQSTHADHEAALLHNFVYRGFTS